MKPQLKLLIPCLFFLKECSVVRTVFRLILALSNEPTTAASPFPPLHLKIDTYAVSEACVVSCLGR